ncbi:protein-disulfide reductase DsbD domain-containing protein [Mesorhizobium xinjiangense]|uniref:protein-disulfide reductase DsbD domain-containing protein n=1 Tax=Mesorhizobium xinjiangense TaxID=2678685 RepID=UPI0018DE5C48|nr:protein-disulfide reductase DsbD domain-containing protein [Mesorhizobium xinjiangense]
MIRHIVPLFALGLCLASPALASSSDIVETEGGTIRLVTSGIAGPDGRIRGALEIGLKPGWKTYWRDPGASGVPPQIDIGQSVNVESAEIRYPAPQWHDEGYGAWAGYDKSLALPITFTASEPDRFSLIEADVFLGICETICIPVRARLTVEPGKSPDNKGDEVVVAAAHAAVPPQAGPEFGISSVDLRDGTLTIAAVVPAEEEDMALFVAGSQGYGFGVPKLTSVVDGEARFQVPLTTRSETPNAPAAIDYTLRAGGHSVTGTFEIP